MENGEWRFAGVRAKMRFSRATVDFFARAAYLDVRKRAKKASVARINRIFALTPSIHKIRAQSKRFLCRK
ncbi:MAG: hypothetical protein FWH03_03105 [Firmicutes bacterium]|nr:hypothetical protein [Bacillota bacterium]